MADLYDSFATLAANEIEGVDYRIHIAPRASPFAIVAPHGGRIERGTSQIAAAIASNRFSLYCFESLRPRAKGKSLHIASTRFDEPQALRLVAASEIAMGVHGRIDGVDRASVWVGGLHESLRDAICDALVRAGFEAKAVGEGHRLSGRDPANICNRCGRGAGVQLELPETLRTAMANEPSRRAALGAAVRDALERAGPLTA
ncbi:poly-gamma-glutamate hydrolase family protein [Methylocystis sp. 9N]|uniref:Poly-gamma-glutamate hydrolase family protein n=1 Tax=Methylocystis borbori TaxID=3118750 RepID=A0ABU7XCT4_9HYPH